MTHEARAPAKQRDYYRKHWTGMTEDLNREQCAADRPDHRMNGVPDGIDPRNFVSQKFEEIKKAGNGDDPRVTEHFERLVIRCERDPVKMNRESGGEDSQIKVDAGEGGQAERHGEQIQSLHSKIIGAPP